MFWRDSKTIHRTDWEGVWALLWLWLLPLSVALTREGLLHKLSGCLTRLPSMFRLLIASQDAPEIHVALSSLDVDLCYTLIDNKLVSDIGLLFGLQLSGNTHAFALCCLLAERKRNAATHCSVWKSFHLGINNHLLHWIWLSWRKVGQGPKRISASVALSTNDTCIIQGSEGTSVPSIFQRSINSPLHLTLLSTCLIGIRPWH